ncbi:hypothetical protein KUV61_16155 [Nocardioides marinus]|nr:hypothetical protein [Nocardioides marinus]
MSDDETSDDLRRWVRIVNKGHSYTGVFNSENSDDKRIVEISTIEEWRKSVLAEFGIEMATPRANPQPPPPLISLFQSRIESSRLNWCNWLIRTSNKEPR